MKGFDTVSREKGSKLRRAISENCEVYDFDVAPKFQR